MSTAEERIVTFPLKALGAEIRGDKSDYFVATISPGMNDREEYACLFANAPDLLLALRALLNAVAEAQRAEILNTDRGAVGLDDALAVAGAAVTRATINWAPA